MVRPPKTAVTPENWRVLQLLDVFAMLDKAPVNADDPYRLLADCIRDSGIAYKDLLDYADRLYGDRILLHIAHAASLKKRAI